MNRHFQDARYYLKRAGEHAVKGVTETLDPVAAKGRELVGREEPEAGRVDRLRSKLEDAGGRDASSEPSLATACKDAGEQITGDVRAIAADARRRVRRYRGA